MTNCLLNQCQVTLSPYLSCCECNIVNHPRELNRKADYPTTRPWYIPNGGGGDESWKNIEQVVLKKLNLFEQLQLFADSLPIQEGLSCYT